MTRQDASFAQAEVARDTSGMASAGPSSGPPSTLFDSFFLGGFECSTHKRNNGTRRDLLAATEHDARAREDYLLLRDHGVRSVRDGLRWHLIERRPRRYDFSSFVPMLHAARDTRTQVIWDLMHYGWPNHIDIWRPEFVDRFALFARAVAEVVKNETDAVPFYTPINEISFAAWGGGDVQYLNPFARGRGRELKDILVRATIAAIEAVRDVDARARIVMAEPLIWIHPRSSSAEDIASAARHNEGQFEAMDFVAGLRSPELGGKGDYLDIVGVNYYYDNQWIDHGPRVSLGSHKYRPLSELLSLASDRYGRPSFIAETGTEGSARASWLHYVCDEVATARGLGASVEGVCLYPILNHPGWDDDRPCQNGLFCGVAPNGARTVHQPLARELQRQQIMLDVG